MNKENIIAVDSFAMLKMLVIERGLRKVKVTHGIIPEGVDGNLATLCTYAAVGDTQEARYLEHTTTNIPICVSGEYPMNVLRRLFLTDYVTICTNLELLPHGIATALFSEGNRVQIDSARYRQMLEG